MAKLKAELEQTEWQVLLMLAGRGYNEVSSKIAEQLNAQMPMTPQQPPAGNGADAPRAEQPQ